MVKSDMDKKGTGNKQLELFQEKENPLIAEIRGLDINNLSPVRALNLIDDWKKKLNLD